MAQQSEEWVTDVEMIHASEASRLLENTENGVWVLILQLTHCVTLEKVLAFSGPQTKDPDGLCPALMLRDFMIFQDSTFKWRFMVVSSITDRWFGDHNAWNGVYPTSKQNHHRKELDFGLALAAVNKRMPSEVGMGSSGLREDSWSQFPQGSLLKCFLLSYPTSMHWVQGRAYATHPPSPAWSSSLSW